MTDIYQANDGLWHVRVSADGHSVELRQHYFTRDAARNAAATVPCHLVIAQLLGK